MMLLPLVAVLALVVLVVLRWRWGTWHPPLIGVLIATPALTALVVTGDRRDLVLGLLVASSAVFAHLQVWRDAFARRSGVGGRTPALAALCPVVLLALCWGSLLPSGPVLTGAALTVLVSFVGVVLARGAVGTADYPVAGVRTLANSIGGYGFFGFACCAAALAGPLLLLGARRRQLLTTAYARLMMAGVFLGAPVVTFRWRDSAAQLDDAAVVVANHEGILDIVGALRLPGRRAMLAKTWVFRTPVLGWGAWALGARNVDDLEAGHLTTGDRDRVLAPFTGIFVFPEGRRSRDGAMQRFHQGAFALAAALAVPVQPVVFAGSRPCIRPGSMWIHPSLMVAAVLAPSLAAADETPLRWSQRCRRAMIDAHTALRRELALAPRQILRRRSHSFGLPPAMRRAARAEETAGAWRAVVAHARSADDPWLVIGAGWGTAVLALREVFPAARVILVDDDPARLRAARHQWWRDGDRLVSAEAVPDGSFSGVLSQRPADAAWPCLAMPVFSSDAVALVPADDAESWSRHLEGWRVIAHDHGLAILQNEHTT